VEKGENKYKKKDLIQDTLAADENMKPTIIKQETL